MDNNEIVEIVEKIPRKPSGRKKIKKESVNNDLFFKLIEKYYQLQITLSELQSRFSPSTENSENIQIQPLTNDEKFKLKKLIRKTEKENDNTMYQLYLVFEKFVKGMGLKYNFSGYSYLPDMKAQAIYKCIDTIKNGKFKLYSADTSLSKRSPYNYFFRVIYNEFIAFINMEKRNEHINYNIVRSSISDKDLFMKEFREFTDKEIENMKFL